MGLRITLIIGAVLMLLLVPLYWLGIETIWCQLVDTISRPDFWVDNFLIFVLYGLFVSLVSSTMQEWFRKRTQKKFEGWKIVFKDGEKNPTEELFWRDVERYRDSKAELWKAIKPVVRDNTRKDVQGRIGDAADWLDTGDLYSEDNFEKAGANKTITIDKELFGTAQAALQNAGD